jgi:hypothetical protein
MRRETGLSIIQFIVVCGVGLHHFFFSYHDVNDEKMSPYLSPILSPSITTPPSLDATPSVSRQLSTKSIQSLADLIVCASTSSRLPESCVEVVKEAGLRHAKINLEAR